MFFNVLLEEKECKLNKTIFCRRHGSPAAKKNKNISLLRSSKKLITKSTNIPLLTELFLTNKFILGVNTRLISPAL